MISLFDLLEATARRQPLHAALVHQDTSLSYADLQAQASAAARGLASLGAARGDRIAIYCDKRIELVVAMLGCVALGAVFVPVNPQLKPHQVLHILEDAEVKLLVTTANRHEALLSEAGARMPQVVLFGGNGKEGPPQGPAHDWQDLVCGNGQGFAPAGVTDGDIAAILYTSGSTGMPKGVMVSHRNLVAGADSVNRYLGNQPSDVILSVLPLSFDAGLSQLTTALAIGATLVLVNFLVAAEVVRACQKHGVTVITAIPPLWHLLSSAAWPADAARNIRCFANTGGHMPGALLGKLRGLFVNARPYLMYGLTEAFRSTYLDPEEIDRRPGSIGKAVPNAQILVLRPDGTECDANEAGELVHRGAFVTLGYWKDPARTSEKFRPLPGHLQKGAAEERAVWSGDIVTRDRDGFLYFVGRKDDLIKVSGHRVSPTEVEEVLLSTGLVLEAIVCGVAHATLGQEIVAFAVPASPSLASLDLIRQCKARLPNYMVPARVFFLAQLPRNPNGKFDRNAVMRDHLDAHARPAAAELQTEGPVA